MELYYNLPKTLLEKTRIIKTAKVYVRGIDLFCADNLDEADAESYGVTAPLTKSIVAGVALSF